MKKIVLFLLLPFFLADCMNKKEVQQPHTYFDLTGFFQSEQIALKDRKLIKTLYFKEKTEKQFITHPEWKKEFQLFTESDINKISWIKSYKIDSTQGKNITSLSFRALDPHLKTRSIIIQKNNLKIIRIEILNTTSNNLYSSFQKLIYYPGKSYEIIGGQDVRLMGKNFYYIHGFFE